MNIFYLDDDLDKNAEYHIDKHIVKMPTEVAQMLTTAIWVDKFLGFVPRSLTSEELGIINKIKQVEKDKDIDARSITRFLPTHPNHPCSVWVRSSADNFEWTFCYLDALHREWQYRYNHTKNHKSFQAGIDLPQPIQLSYRGLTTRPLCIKPISLIVENDPIKSYREFYIHDKKDFASWKNREPPPWWQEKN